jgi:hypothetical protein
VSWLAQSCAVRIPIADAMKQRSYVKLDAALVNRARILTASSAQQFFPCGIFEEI